MLFNKAFGNNDNSSSTVKTLPADMEDLINLSGPLTEDAVMKTLQSRFNDKNYFVSKMKKQMNIV